MWDTGENRVAHVWPCCRVVWFSPHTKQLCNYYWMYFFFFHDFDSVISEYKKVGFDSWKWEAKFVNLRDQFFPIFFFCSRIIRLWWKFFVYSGRWFSKGCWGPRYLFLLFPFSCVCTAFNEMGQNMHVRVTTELQHFFCDYLILWT